MRWPLRGILAALALFALAAVATYAGGRLLGPGLVRSAAERALSRELGVPVRVARAHFTFAGGLAIEAADLEAWHGPISNQPWNHGP